MWIAPVIAAATLVCLALSKPAALAAGRAPAGPLVFLALHRVVDQPAAGPRRSAAAADQTVFLQKLSRKTWAFFETFVGPEEHWLPPDNFQEHPPLSLPTGRLRRTWGSRCWRICPPHDFGYISARQLIERTTNALATMEALERHQGHFYNWYDTQSLKPLPPKYVSTVDSGNLAGHLLTLAAGTARASRPDDPESAGLRRAPRHPLGSSGRRGRSPCRRRCLCRARSTSAGAGAACKTRTDHARGGAAAARTTRRARRAVCSPGLPAWVRPGATGRLVGARLCRAMPGRTRRTAAFRSVDRQRRRRDTDAARTGTRGETHRAAERIADARKARAAIRRTQPHGV